MDVDNALEQLASAPLEQIDLSGVETGVMRGLAQTTAVIRSQMPIRVGAAAAALVVGISLGGFSAAASNEQQGGTLVSGAHLAPTALLALAS